MDSFEQIKKDYPELNVNADGVAEAVRQYCDFLVQQGKDPISIAISCMSMGYVLLRRASGNDLNETLELARIVHSRIEQEIQNDRPDPHH